MSKKNIITTLIILVVCLLVLILLIIGAYRYDWPVGLPAAFVNWDIITLADFREDVKSVKQFYEKQSGIDFSSEEGQKEYAVLKKSVLGQKIENSLVKSLAEDRDIEITSKMIDSEVEAVINEIGNKDQILETLKRLYDWDLNDFKEKVVMPQMYIEALEKEINQNFYDWFDEQRKKSNIFIFYPSYRWDKEEGILVFVDQKLNDYEKKQQEILSSPEVPETE